MELTKSQIRDVYRRRSANYDLTANLYYLIGFREVKFRKQAVSALGLEQGDTVIELGCGTGLNFSYLLEAIGPSGKLIGIGLTDAMLDKARARVQRNAWLNVELVHGDIADYAFPSSVKGVFSSFAFTLVPEYEEVIRRVSEILAPGGRFVILDLKKPEKWPLWLVKLGVMITRPFGVSLDLTDRKPWLVMQRYFAKVSMTELYGGFVYCTIAEK